MNKTTKPNRPDVALLERLNSERTPGEWSLLKGDSLTSIGILSKSEYLDLIAKGVCPEDAAFIAAAANEMTGLLEYVKRLERALKDVQNANGCPYDEDYVTTTAREALEGLGCD